MAEEENFSIQLKPTVEKFCFKCKLEVVLKNFLYPRPTLWRLFEIRSSHKYLQSHRSFCMIQRDFCSMRTCLKWKAKIILIITISIMLLLIQVEKSFIILSQKASKMFLLWLAITRSIYSEMCFKSFEISRKSASNAAQTFHCKADLKIDGIPCPSRLHLNSAQWLMLSNYIYDSSCTSLPAFFMEWRIFHLKRQHLTPEN